ncbi:MAG: HEAT repeat domain-containing protein [Archangium sp.]|nr:HEAT repeat domain-containing protein [Archangium sp.]
MRYEFVEGSSSKFWEVDLSGTAFTVKWGRIGTDGQTQQKKFDSAGKAQAEHDKLVAEKVKKGYRALGGAPAKKVAQKVSTRTGPFFLHVSHHQFSLEDSKNTGQSFNFDNLDEGLEAAKHGVVVHLRRAASRIPMVVEVRGDAPPADYDTFHLVTEGSFEAPSGSLEIASPEETWKGGISVPGGWLRVQVRQADTDTSTYDGGDGADHYRVILWPAPQAKTRVLHSRDVKDGVVFKPKARLADVERDLASRDPTVCCLAAVEAARHLVAGDKKALAVLKLAVKHEHDAVRAVTLSALGLAGTQSRGAVFELISSRIGDSAPEVRQRVPEAFSRLGGKDGASAMVSLLQAKDGVMAKDAGLMMWTVAEHVDVAEVLPLLSHKRAETRLAALHAVKTVGDSKGWEAVSAAGAAVRALMKDKDRTIKELAASMVEKLGAPVDELLALAKSKDEAQRASAATSLGKSRSPAAFDVLVAMLHKDKDLGVQRTAAEALGLLGDRRAISHLAKHLENGVFNLNWYACRALAKLGGPEATKLLWKYVSMADADERFDYIGREAADRLAEMMYARKQVQAGEALDAEHSASPDLDDSVVKVSSLTGSKDDRLCERGLKLLQYGDDVETVAAALSRTREDLLDVAVRTLRDMLSGPQSEALKKRAAKAVAPHAAAMAKVGSKYVRSTWIDVLGSIGGAFAYDTALAALKDGEPEVRAQAARTLGQLGPDRAVEAIVALFDDKHGNVRHAAADALGFCVKEKAAAKKALAAFLEVAKGSAKSVAQRSLEELG